MPTAGVIGATGYAGAELVKLLAGHPDVELTILTSRQYAGKRFDSVYPAMTGYVDMTCQAYDLDEVCERADILFTALPHELPMEIVPDLLARGKRVVDLSADFRFKSPETYAAHYLPHRAQHLLTQAVYGLAEVYTPEIQSIDLVGNPGCYPTSILLPLIPLFKSGLVGGGPLIADAKSGVSGAGRSPSLTTHFCEVDNSFKAYKVAEHRHNPEIDEVLSRWANATVHLTFVPHLVPMTRGMLTTIYLTLKQKVLWREIHDCLSTFYEGRPFVRLCPEGRFPDTAHVWGTNCCDIGFRVHAPDNSLVMISAIDNLVKGASGQAVQNMNIMLGLDETRGLFSVPQAV